MNSNRFLPSILGAAFAACALMAQTSQAAGFVFDEATDGDLSGLASEPNQFGNSPLSIGYSIGSNTILGSTVAGDYDILNFTVGPGELLTAINVVSYVSTDDRAFLAVQSGSRWQNGLGGGANFTVGTLLGYAHFGTHAAAAQAGTDILDNLGAGAGAIGFSGPLGPGTYTFLIQQTGAAVVNYGLDFQLTAVPEPSEYAGMAGALLGGFGLWRRIRSCRA